MECLGLSSDILRRLFGYSMIGYATKLMVCGKKKVHAYACGGCGDLTVCSLGSLGRITRSDNVYIACCTCCKRAVMFGCFNWLSDALKILQSVIHSRTMLNIVSDSLKTIPRGAFLSITPLSPHLPKDHR